MTAPSRPRPLMLLAALCTALILAGCGGGEDVTAQSLHAARQRWDQAGIRDYDLEWTSTGASPAHYRVEVRGGKVGTIESVSKGKATPVSTAEPKFYGVEGLFLVIADELALRETDHPFGQPKGTRVVLRFTPDPKLGYPKSYRRDVLGTPLALAIDVVRFEPRAPATR